MNIVIREDKEAMGLQAAVDGAEQIRNAIRDKGAATIIVATGASQFTMLDNLIRQPDIDWSVVTGFHLDEYLGLPISHPASFRKYLKERFVDHLSLKAFHYIDGEVQPIATECDRLSKAIQQHEVDVAFVGIGENAHLAFNDPPADFDTQVPYLVVDLDDACRKQQLGEGWFPTFEDVPKQAISMSVQQILKSKSIVCTVPDQRKAQAVAESVEGTVSQQVPASILQRHEQTTLYLDRPAASLLRSSAT
ncbi:MAG: glucosamine-6-phosphate deaminase [Planctomycetaceae bacterium]|nr:glucosamine-6-phosphate deaminase [Planctomycetaceae bacterium]